MRQWDEPEDMDFINTVSAMAAEHEASNPYTALHEEFAQMVSAGFTEAQALELTKAGWVEGVKNALRADDNG